MQIKQLNTWRELTEEFDKTFEYHKKHGIASIHFRGQSNFDWKLEPSLLRILKGEAFNKTKAEGFEAQSLLEFRSQVHLLDSSITYSFNALSSSIMTDMQHFSCPTRLLDWSESPYIALYFAVNENFEKDGAIFLWDYLRYRDKMNCKYKNHRDLKSKDILVHTDYDFLDIIYSLRKNNRIVRQQGSFSISNNILRYHDDVIIEAFENEEVSGLFKIIIPKELKLECLAKLRTMNISAETLFPGLDGLGRSIKEHLQLRKWSS